MNGHTRSIVLALVCVLAAGCATPQPTAVRMRIRNAENGEPIQGASASGEIEPAGWFRTFDSEDVESDKYGILTRHLPLGENDIVQVVAPGYQRRVVSSEYLLASLSVNYKDQTVDVNLLPERGPLILRVPEKYRGAIVVKFVAPSRIKDPPCRKPVRMDLPESGLVEVAEPGLYVPGQYFPPVFVERGELPLQPARDPDREWPVDGDMEQVITSDNLIRRFPRDSNGARTRFDLVSRTADTCVYVLNDNWVSNRTAIDRTDYYFSFIYATTDFERQTYFQTVRTQPRQARALASTKSDTVIGTGN